MIIGFRSKATEDIYHGHVSKDARSIPRDVWKTAQRKLDYLDGAAALSDLRIPPGNRLEALKGNLDGKHSIRINDQYRIIFRYRDGNAHEVEIIDYH